MRTLFVSLFVILPLILRAQHADTTVDRHCIIASFGNGQALFWRSLYADPPSFQPHFGVRYLYTPDKEWFKVGLAIDLTFNYLNKSYDIPFRRQLGSIGGILRLNGRLTKWLSVFIEPGIGFAYSRKILYPRATSPSSYKTPGIRSDFLAIGPRVAIGADIRISNRLLLEIAAPQLVFTSFYLRYTDTRERSKGFPLPASLGIGYKF